MSRKQVRNITLYVKDSDKPIWNRARRLAKGNLSAFVSEALGVYTMMKESDQDVDHKYCSGCGGKMQEKSYASSYDRRTGLPVSYAVWECARAARDETGLAGIGRGFHDSVVRER